MCVICGQTIQVKVFPIHMIQNKDKERERREKEGREREKRDERERREST